MAGTTQVQGTGRICPSCGAAVSGKSRCAKCGLEVDKMRAFAAAKEAAARRGIKEVQVEREARAWQQPKVIAGALVAVLVVVLGIMAFAKKSTPPPPWWSTYPLTRQSAVEQFLAGVGTGVDAGYMRAYALVPVDARDPNNPEEPAQYRQVFHNMNRYLTGEFGEGWERNAVVTEDPANPDRVAVKVDLETIHLTLKQVTPAESVATAGQHFGVLGVDEFSVAEAGDAQQKAAIMGLIGGVAGQGAVNNLNMIMGGVGGGPRMSKTQRKIMLVPILANPRQVARRTILHTWPLRQDPVVRARLEKIVQDGRYPMDVQKTAKEVLDDRVDETDLIAAGVAD